MESFLKKLEYVKKRVTHNSCRDLIWFMNILPTLAGFSFYSEKIVVLFWIIHIILLLYVYIFATVMYQMFYATKYLDAVNSFLNMSIVILILNSSGWILLKRADLKVVLKLIKKNDDLVTTSSGFLDRHRKFMRQIKLVLIFYFMLHCINDICIFIPTRAIGLKDFTIGSCFGLEPMAASPNREVCMALVTFQELTSIAVVAGYDAALIFLQAHTTAMYNILSEDIMSLNDVGTSLPLDRVSIRLKNFILRHSFLLETVQKLQDTYGSAIGIGCGVNAMSLCLFMFLPFDLWVDSAPIVYYSLILFFLYCYQGQRLTTATEKMEMAVYCCGWEKFTLDDQKLVLCMLKQSQKSIKLLAGHVVPMRIHTFAYTMQSIYRFVAVFKF